MQPVAAAHGAVFPVRIESPSGCPDLRLARDSRRERGRDDRPAWLRERLRRVGLNSISPIVDVTNYVMMDLGQPLHAYDLAPARGASRCAQARPGERITLLDDKEYALDPDFLLIADASGAIGLAGIMGGQGHGDR